MKNKWITLAAFGLCTAMLAGCGDGTEGELGTSDYARLESMAAANQAQLEASSSEESQPEKSELAQYEEKYSTGNLAPEEYPRLAELYREAGRIRQQRDILEQSWSLHGNQEAYIALQNITVDVAEENVMVQEKAQLLMQNLELPEYHNEAVAVLYGQDWYSAMMPKLKEGKRTYYMHKEDSSAQMVWQVGYDKQFNQYTAVWYQNGEALTFLKQNGESVQMVTTSLVGGVCQGAYESWIVVSSTGDVYHETGTMQNGVLVGDYTVQASYGAEASDLFSLWGSREGREFTEYKGSFSETGATNVKQPKASEQKTTNGGIEDSDSIIYAYTADEKKYLFLSVPEGTDSSTFVFSAKVLGMEEMPEYTPYVPVTPGEEESEEQEEAQMVNAADIQVRIYDNNIEWFDGKKWHTAGPVENYKAQDPFGGYGGRQLEVPVITDENGQETAVVISYEERGAGTIKKPGSNKPANNTKPNKPTTPPTTPTEPATPETPATPPPAPPAQNNNSGGGNNENNTPPPSEPNQDVDVEWTEDFL